MASLACSRAPESTGGALQAEQRGSTPAPEAEADAPACMPDLAGLRHAGIEPTEVTCPRGYVQRKSLAALPIAGRFTTATELRDAFCIEETSTPASELALLAPSRELQIDFASSDVVAYAFDARSGAEPELLQRGNELWLRVTTTACSGDAPELASIAFVVAKGEPINEQRCSLACP